MTEYYSSREVLIISNYFGGSHSSSPESYAMIIPSYSCDGTLNSRIAYTLPSTTPIGVSYDHDTKINNNKHSAKVGAISSPLAAAAATISSSVTSTSSTTSSSRTLNDITSIAGEWYRGPSLRTSLSIGVMGHDTLMTTYLYNDTDKPPVVTVETCLVYDKCGGVSERSLTSYLARCQRIPLPKSSSKPSTVAATNDDDAPSSNDGKGDKDETDSIDTCISIHGTGSSGNSTNLNGAPNKKHGNGNGNGKDKDSSGSGGAPRLNFTDVSYDYTQCVTTPWLHHIIGEFVP
jgi:hypothetical protein